jgi:hypothetical protein
VATVDELRGTTKEGSPTGKARSAEKVLAKTRSQHPLSGKDDKVTSDDESGIVTAQVGGILKKRAMCLTVEVYNVVRCCLVHYEGQAFILRNPADHESLHFFTAKRNMASEENREGEYEICSATLSAFPRDGVEGCVPFPDCGWDSSEATPFPLRHGETWASGLDLCLGPQLTSGPTAATPSFLVLLIVSSLLMWLMRHFCTGKE